MAESAVDRRLAEARARLTRVEPTELDAAARAGALVVDIRPESDRLTDGRLPGAVVVERIHLEWRLDPTGAHRLPGVTADRHVIVVCNEGYASSLAAADLQALGLSGATDLVGGHRAWRALHPTEE